MPRPAVDLDPADTAARHELRTRITNLRVAAGWSQKDLALHVGTTTSTVSSFDTYPSNSTITTYDRYAVPFGQRVTLRAVNIAGYRQTPVAAMLEAAGWFARAEMERLIAARTEAGLARATVADIMQVLPPSLTNIERSDREPMVSTLQRYARALGGRLDLDLERYPDE